MSTTHAPAAWNASTACTAFGGDRVIASGPLKDVAAKAKCWLDRHADPATLLIFDDASAQQIEVDFRGSVETVLSKLPKAGPPAPESDAERPTPRGPGRPKLGVVAREVTLLPRHWEWLNRQPGGASVALRKLVEAARRTHAGADRVRQAQEAAYRFLSAMAGNRPGFEEAARALFAGSSKDFAARTARWPGDIRTHAEKLAQPAFAT